MLALCFGTLADQAVLEENMFWGSLARSFFCPFVYALYVCGGHHRQICHYGEIETEEAALYVAGPHVI